MMKPLFSRFTPMLMAAALAVTACVPSAALKQAQQAMASGDLEGAHAYYIQVLNEAPNNMEAKQALAKIRNELTTRAISEADGQCQGKQPVDAPTLRRCMAILERAAVYDPDGTRLGAHRRQYEQRLKQIDQQNGERVEAVKSAIAAERFTQAQTTISQIQQTDPQFAGLMDLKRTYTQSYGAYLENRIQSAYASGDIRAANQAFEKWSALGFPPADQARMQDLVKTQEKRLVERKVKELTAAKQFYKAHLLLSRSRNKADYGDLAASVRRRGAPFYLQQAQRRLEEGDTSRAYLEAVKGVELDEALPGMFEMHRDTRDHVLENVQKYIAIPAFDASSSNPDAGTQFSDALISYLFRILPYGINIVERGKIDILMQEHKREFSQVATILNVDLIVTGNVSLLKVDRQDNQRQSTVRVPVGERSEINPEYEVFIKTSSAKSGETPPPKTIKVKEYGNFTINKGSTIVKGFANVAVRIFDTSKGRITYAQEFNANYQASDNYQDALELAGIEGDPLVIPTDTEVKEKLRSQIVKQLADVIQKQFEKRERHFLETADYYKSRKEDHLAIQQLARGFLYCVKAKVPFDDSDFTRIRETIIDLTETGFI